MQKKWLTSTGAAALALTTAITANGATELSHSKIKGSDDIEGKTTIPLEVNGKSHWLLSSEDQGLMLVNEKGNIISKLEGEYELLDIRSGVMLNSKPSTLAATLDAERNQIVIAGLNATSGKISELTRLPTHRFNVDGLCLYKGEQNHTYLFVLDGRGVGEQWILADGVAEALSPKLVKALHAPLNSSYCSVNDETHTLFISEEDAGIWAYGAKPEAPLERALVQVIEPHGKAENVAGVSAFPGGMMSVDPDNAMLHVFTLDGTDATSETIYKLDSIEEAEAVASRVVNGKLDIAIYDDEDRSFSTEITLPENKQDVEESMPIVMASVQTPPMGRFGDVADDPAIWVHPKDATKSRVIGTNKKHGLHVYDMAGNEVQELALGHLNNVDVRYGFKLNGQQVDVATATNRSENSISVFSIDRNSGELSVVGDIPTGMKKVYGLCMYQSKQGTYVFANNKKGAYQQYQLVANGDKIDGKLVREFSVESQPEGCVANDVTGDLFVGEENVGIWVIGAEANAGTELASVLKIDGPIEDDIEGISLYHGKKQDYLVISSQGNDSYAITDAKAPYTYRGSFRVGLNPAKGIDGTSETDGLDVTNINLGGDFAEGMLVVQDGRNLMPSAGQDFKYIPWSAIRETLKLAH